MNHLKFFYCFFFIGLLVFPFVMLAQVPLAPKTTTTSADDTLVTVEILQARKLEMRKVNDSTQLQILAGAVKIRLVNTFFDCYSCFINNNNNTF